MTLKIKHWQDPINLILGVWMVASPWVLSYSTASGATGNALLFGGLIVAVAISALLEVMAWEEWVTVALGVWLAISPWILGFSGLTMAMWNAVIIGIAVAALALWVLGTDKDIGGWWSPAA